MPKGKRRMVRVLIILPEDMVQQVNELAERLALARSSFIRLLILEGLQKREKPEPPKAN